MRGQPREVQIYEARLNARTAVAGVEFENAVHARERKHDAALRRYRPAAQSRAGASRNDGFVAVLCDLHGCRNVERRGRKHDRLRHAPLRIRIERIDREIFGLSLYRIGAERIGEPLKKHQQFLEGTVPCAF